MRLSRAFSDLTIGWLIVMIHARLAQRLGNVPGETPVRPAPRQERQPDSSHRRAADPRAYIELR